MQPTELDIKQIIAILQRQRKLVLLTVLVVVGLAFAYIMTATPIFQATALIQIDTGGSNLLDPSTGDNEQSAILNSRVDSEVEILRSQATALAVIQSANLISDVEFGPRLGMMEKIGQALGVSSMTASLRSMLGLGQAAAPDGTSLLNATLQKFEAAVDVRRRGLTYLIAVSVNSESPERAAAMANAYVKTYIERQIASKTSSTLAGRDVLRRQITLAQQELAKSEDLLNSFIEDNLGQLEAESGNASVADLRNQLEKAKSDQRESSGILTSAETAIGNGEWDKAAATLGDAALAELAKQRAELAQQLSAEAQGSAAFNDVKEKLAQIDTDLAAQSSQSLGALQSEVATIGKRESQARDQLRTTLLQSDLSSQTLAGLYSLQQSATIARNQYQQLLSREQDLGAMANLQIADARVVSEALAPSTPAFPNKRLTLALAIVAALGIGVGLAFLNEYYIGGVTSASQLSNVLQAKVPVAIPSLVLSADDIVFADQIVTAPLSVYAETFRKLRSTVDNSLAQLRGEQFRASGDSTNSHGAVILVCSALPAEGKTTSSLALARTYAMSGMKTLLIEVDLRKPALSRYSGVESQVGLLEYLRTDKADADRSIETIFDPLSNMAMITAGGRSNLPTDQMINSRAFRSLLEIACKTYDVVVLDSPPVLPVVDTRYLAQYADVVVQVVRYASTTQGEVREAANLLREMMRPGVQLVGALSHEQHHSKGSGYYGGKYAGYYGEGE